MKREYPYYGKSIETETIVYFTDESTGTVIVESKGSWKKMTKGRTWKEYENFNIITDPQEIKKLDKKRFFLNLSEKEVDPSSENDCDIKYVYKSAIPIKNIKIDFKIKKY